MASVPSPQQSTLRAIRLARGLKLSPVAKQADIDPAHLSRIERGLSLPTLPVLARLAFALNIDPRDLLMALPVEAIFRHAIEDSQA